MSSSRSKRGWPQYVRLGFCLGIECFSAKQRCLKCRISPSHLLIDFLLATQLQTRCEWLVHDSSLNFAIRGLVGLYDFAGASHRHARYAGGQTPFSVGQASLFWVSSSALYASFLKSRSHQRRFIFGGWRLIASDSMTLLFHMFHMAPHWLEEVARR